jgi:hypothetical protein
MVLVGMRITREGHPREGHTHGEHGTGTRAGAPSAINVDLFPRSGSSLENCSVIN